MNIEQRYKDLKITNYTCNGKCSCCGNCCGDILPISKAEIKIIDKYIKEKDIKPTPKCILVKYDNTCPFRDNENKLCKIYEIRPEICKSYICNKSAEEAYKNREIHSKGKLPRSMRNLFFNENGGAKFLYENMGMSIYDRNDKIIRE